MVVKASLSEPVSVALVLCLIYILALASYRLYFSPLARFPGPRLAALTSWYEFYHDCVRRGRFTWDIKSMHDRYGPIVRITPHELHINDPHFSDTIYSYRAKLDRDVNATRQFGMDDATVFTVQHDKHRMRRGALAPFFSRNMILTSSYGSIVTQKVEKLCARINEHYKSKQPMSLGLAFKCLATDVITEYALGKSYDLLDTPDYSAAWFEAQRSAGEFVLLGKHFPWLIHLMRSLPAWMIKRLSPQIGTLITREKAIADKITRIMNEKGEDLSQKDPRPNLFHHLLLSNLPPQELTVPHLTREGIVVVSAGSDTTGIALTVTTFYLLNNPTMLASLQNELEETLPDPQSKPTWADLEDLPYLSAIVKEGLRLAHGTSNRLPRVSKTSMNYGGWTISPNTPLSMSPMLIHENEDLYPNHREFRPGRWLDPNCKNLEKYLMTFGKGPRACLGMHLAYAELYVTLATIFRRFEFKLFETGREDVDAEHDFMVPCPRLGSKGVRVMVKKSRMALGGY